MNSSTDALNCPFFIMPCVWNLFIYHALCTFLKQRRKYLLISSISNNKVLISTMLTSDIEMYSDVFIIEPQQKSFRWNICKLYNGIPYELKKPNGFKFPLIHFYFLLSEKFFYALLLFLLSLFSYGLHTMYVYFSLSYHFKLKIPLFNINWKMFESKKFSNNLEL